MAFFISDTLSALGPDISAWELIDSMADISGPSKHFCKLTNYNVIQIMESSRKGYDIFQNCVIYFFYQLAKVISGRC